MGRVDVRKLVYIAGPISSPACIRVAERLYRFTQCENALLRAGYAPVNPAADWAAVSMGGVDYEMLMERDHALISACDAVYLLRGWQNSAGALQEAEWARLLHIPRIEEGEEGFEAEGFGKLDKALGGNGH